MTPRARNDAAVMFLCVWCACRDYNRYLRLAMRIIGGAALR